MVDMKKHQKKGQQATCHPNQRRTHTSSAMTTYLNSMFNITDDETPF